MLGEEEEEEDEDEDGDDKEVCDGSKLDRRDFKDWGSSLEGFCSHFHSVRCLYHSLKKIDLSGLGLSVLPKHLLYGDFRERERILKSRLKNSF